MVYFDMHTRGKQWMKPGIPIEVFTANTDLIPATDWMKLDVSQHCDLNEACWKPIDVKGK